MLYRIIILFIFFTSCLEETQTLPGSTGSNSEIIFVVDDASWDRFIEKDVRSIFSGEIPGIGKTESSFKVIQINSSEFNSLLRTHKNIVFISNDTVFKVSNNVWAKNQTVGYIGYRSDGVFIENCNILFKAFYDNELSSLRRKLSRETNLSYSKNLKQTFGIEVIIPSEYSLRIDSSGFKLFSYNPPKKEIIKHILFASIPYTDNNRIDSIIMNTNRITSKILEGASEDSYVILEPDFYPKLYNGSYRALWKLHNGFMGGPIIIKPYVVDNRLILVIALVFSPQSSKRGYVKEFEAIL